MGFNIQELQSLPPITSIREYDPDLELEACVGTWCLTSWPVDYKHDFPMCARFKCEIWATVLQIDGIYYAYYRHNQDEIPYKLLPRQTGFVPVNLIASLSDWARGFHEAR